MRARRPVGRLQALGATPGRSLDQSCCKYSKRRLFPTNQVTLGAGPGLAPNQRCSRSGGSFSQPIMRLKENFRRSVPSPPINGLRRRAGGR